MPVVFRDAMGEAPGILRANVLMCFSEEVGNVSSGSGKWQVGIRGENSAKVENGREKHQH